jgi:hypothetical protein
MGPVGRGFRLCDWCGFGQPVGTGEKPPEKHKRADRPGTDCTGPLQNAGFGHEYLTDVVELRLAAHDKLRRAQRAVRAARRPSLAYRQPRAHDVVTCRWM